MKLFHGSNIEVKTPTIHSNVRALDFGAGFYTTSSESQAGKRAKIVTKRRGTGSAMLNIFVLSEEKLSTMKILKFETANAEWLDFVVKNRKALMLDKLYDLVIGPVANDTTLSVIDDYMGGVYTQEEAVRRLLPQNLTDQYAFLSNQALAALSFAGSVLL